MLLSITFKTAALCLRLHSRSRIMLDFSWLYLMPFSIPAAKKILHNFERQYSGQKSLILAELAAMHEGEATSQPLDFEGCLESSNQAFEYLESLLKALESENVLITVMEILIFIITIILYLAKKMPILCSMVEL